MTKLHYLAYGSNLHPLRLRERVPSAVVVGVVKVAGQRLTFSKRGRDGSGKCACSDAGNPSDVVYGVLYQMDASGRDMLDRAEGQGNGYNVQSMDVELGGVCYSAFTYVADSRYIDGSLQPFEWYKHFVMEGARYHSFPRDYLAFLEEVAAIPDPDPGRASENLARLRSMQEFTRQHQQT